MNKFQSVRDSLRRRSAGRNRAMTVGIAAASLVGLALSATAASAQVSPPNAGSTAAPAPAPTPDFTVTGSAGVWSQYRFRGISQSDNKPVIQGALTVTHKSGFYVSTWGSSAIANDAVNLGGTEIDVGGGYAHTLGSSGVTADAGVYGYLYPGSRKAVGISENYFEVYADLAKPFGPVTTKVGINYAPKQAYFRNFATPTRYNVYVYGELGFAPTSFPVVFHSHLGHTGGGLDFAGHSYIDYTVGASYKWKALLFDVSLVGTNLSRRKTDLADFLAGTTDFHRAAKTAIVGSISASF